MLEGLVGWIERVRTFVTQDFWVRPHPLWCTSDCDIRMTYPGSHDPDKDLIIPQLPQSQSLELEIRFPGNQRLKGDDGSSRRHVQTACSSECSQLCGE